MVPKTDENKKLPVSYVDKLRQRQRLRAKLYPQDDNLGELELINARANFLTSDGAIHAGKEDQPLRHKVFVESFVSSILLGLSAAATCEKLEVPRSLYAYWMLAAGKGEEPYCDFAKQIIGAEAAREQFLISELVNAHGSGWKKWQFLLEAHRPERWSRAAINARAESEFHVAKEDATDPDTLKVQVFQVLLPDNGRDGRETIDVTPNQVLEYRKEAEEKV